MKFIYAHNYHKTVALFLVLCAFFVTSSQTVFAQYVPLVGLPQLSGRGEGLAGYFNQLYMITVAVGAILAFIKISIAGVKWSLSEIVTDISDAKNDIKGALLGLVILLVPFVVLNTIYPNLTKLNILENASGVRVNPAAPTPPTTGTPPPSTNPGDLLPPNGGRGQTVVKNCQYTPLSDGTDMHGAPIYTGTYDDTACRTECASHPGSTFKQLSESAGSCTWYEYTACTPGIDCPGDSGYVG